MAPETGTIEGFYGKPWSWEDRRNTVERLKPAGFSFYIYAPKADPYLRRKWQDAYPEEFASNLGDFAASCRENGVRFGVGLTPYEAHDTFGEFEKQAMREKLAFLDSIGVQDLGILFDDMRGDDPKLAEKQLRIVDWIAGQTSADRIIVCPSYYTDDPVLDRVFGERPANYLEDLGKGLDAAAEMFWTGEEVCSRAFSIGHLERVAEQMGRRPFLWDNYPVNDGQRMSEYLHLRGFTGRPAAIAKSISAHSVNPALQPTLSLIPSLTLAMSYEEGDSYSYHDAFHRAAREVAGDEVGELLFEDLLVLQDVGLDRLGDKEARLRERYGSHPDNPAAREVIQWLDGAYRITDEIVQTQ